MMIDRRLIEYFDWWMLGLFIIVGAMGLTTLYSAVHAGAVNSLQGLFARQLVWYGIGAFIMVAAFIINYKIFERWAELIFILCLVLLVAVLFVGTYGGGGEALVDLRAGLRAALGIGQIGPYHPFGQILCPRCKS